MLVTMIALAILMGPETHPHSQGEQPCHACVPQPVSEKVSVSCYASKEETFCAPGPSKQGCRHVETVCDQCRESLATLPEGVTIEPARPNKVVWWDWFPGRAKVYTRKRLLRRVETVEHPAIKWSVETTPSTPCPSDCRRETR